MKLNAVRATLVDDLESSLASSALRVERRVGELPDLLNTLANGAPPILQVATAELRYWNEDTYHALLLTGVEGSTAFVNDPAFITPQTVSVDELTLAWDRMGNYFMVVSSRAAR